MLKPIEGYEIIEGYYFPLRGRKDISYRVDCGVLWKRFGEDKCENCLINKKGITVDCRKAQLRIAKERGIRLVETKSASPRLKSGACESKRG